MKAGEKHFRDGIKQSGSRANRELGELMVEELTNQDGKKDGRGTGGFNGPSVCADRPPAAAGKPHTHIPPL